MWEVIGYERSVVQREGQASYTAVNLHVKKPVLPGTDAAGCRCKTYWYREHEVVYAPCVGDTVIIETELRGKFEVVRDIQKV